MYLGLKTFSSCVERLSKDYRIVDPKGAFGEH